jgi:hypothetical protein
MSLKETLKYNSLKSEKLLYDLIVEKAKENDIELSDDEIKEFFEDIYWALDSDLDLAIHNVKAVD